MNEFNFFIICWNFSQCYVEKLKIKTMRVLAVQRKLHDTPRTL
jgi:hypothetical protein